MAGKNDINKKIQRNYFLVTLFLGFLVILILGRVFFISFVEGKYWVALAQKYYKPIYDSIPATRGNILSCEGELMATTVTYYQLYMDFWADGINDSVFKANVKPLSVELNKLIPEKSAAHYERSILNGKEMQKKEADRIKRGEKVAKKSREYLLSIRQVDYSELLKIKKMPFFNLGRYKSGLYEVKITKRIKPFGFLASRTLGDVKDDVKGGFRGVYGTVGLELAYDSLLQGKPGKITKRWVEGGYKEIPGTGIEAIPGKDIVSTIDLNIQSIIENALLDKLKELNAESGTIVVMEVKSGEIKAIANLGKYKEGAWGEILNYALTDMSEPGSTFKIASMMVALEDGFVQPGDSVDVGRGKFEVAGRLLLDHNANRGGYGKITAAEAIWYSSNIGVSKLIMKAYGKNSDKFVDGLYKLGLTKDLNLEIPGSGKARIRHPKNTEQEWSKTTLPWMSFGYETQIPPIYMLTFFNAIANKGTMVKPIFVKEIRDGRKIERKKTEIINKHICSDRTLKIIHDMMDSVVNHSQGTGRPAHSNLVRIAGKTGTVQLSKGVIGYTAGGTTHQVSFCGYFPAGNPKYSCIVVIRNPSNGNASGGAMNGPVFKRIAEEIYARGITTDPIELDRENTTKEVPKIKNGLFDNSKYALNRLNILFTDSLNGKSVYGSQWTLDQLVLIGKSISNDVVPDVIGMSAKDAVYLLENVGLRVNLWGKGEVYNQSLNAGSKALQGQSITIQLR